MSRLQLITSAEQVAAHLRADLLAGRLRGTMPGVLRLEAELGVNRKTIDAALAQLEREGMLIAQGAGKRRLIVDQPVGTTEFLRVALLNWEPSDRRVDYLIDLQHQLLEAGHVAFHAPRTMTELGANVRRIARMVTGIQADAWIVSSGSKEILQWFSAHTVPTLALFGRRDGVPIAAAGRDMHQAMADAARELIRLGHRRIVLLVRAARRFPQPGLSEATFLNTLAEGGLKVSDYNLPDWKETPEGLRELLQSLFSYTPPTALVIDEATLFAATQQFLAARGLQVPRDVSLICTDDDPTFAWCLPSIAHIRWDTAPVISRVMRWVASISKGKPDLRQTLTPAEFRPGGTIAPARDRLRD